MICWLFMVLWLNGLCFGSEKAEESLATQLTTCTDKKLGVEFLCGAEWQLETDQDALLMIISEEPAITLTVAKTKSPVTFVEELSQPVLKEIGQYADHFDFKRTKVAGEEAIEVNAVAEKFPEIRLRDFYILRGSQLYSILFSVNPQEALERYQPLFKKIIESIVFSDQQSVLSDQN